MDSQQLRLKDADVTVVDSGAVDRILASGCADAALLYLYVVRRGRQLSPESASKDLHLSGARFEIALDIIKKSGALCPAEGSPGQGFQTGTEYTAAELSENRKNDSRFSELCSFFEVSLGRILRKSELSALYSAYTDIKLPAEVIMLMIKYLTSLPRRRLSARELEQEACRWADAGIFTYDAAERHLKKLSGRRAEISDILARLNIIGRSPSPSEEGFISSWLDMGMSAELIEHAYDKTVINTGALKWSYLNRILESWREKGVTEKNQIEKLDVPKRGLPLQAEKTASDLEHAQAEWVRRYASSKKRGV